MTDTFAEQLRRRPVEMRLLLDIIAKCEQIVAVLKDTSPGGGGGSARVENAA